MHRNLLSLILLLALTWSFNEAIPISTGYQSTNTGTPSILVTGTVSQSQPIISNAQNKISQSQTTGPVTMAPSSATMSPSSTTMSSSSTTQAIVSSTQTVIQTTKPIPSSIVSTTKTPTTITTPSSSYTSDLSTSSDDHTQDSQSSIDFTTDSSESTSEGLLSTEIIESASDLAVIPNAPSQDMPTPSNVKQGLRDWEITLIVLACAAIVVVLIVIIVKCVYVRRSHNVEINEKVQFDHTDNQIDLQKVSKHDDEVVDNACDLA